MTPSGIEYNRKRDDDSVTKKRLFCVPFCKIVPPKKTKVFLCNINRKTQEIRSMVTGFGPNGQECVNFLSLVYRAHREYHKISSA